MNYAIETLELRLDNLESNYIRYVTNGDVDKTDVVAITNRRKAEEIKKAIDILKNCL